MGTNFWPAASNRRVPVEVPGSRHAFDQGGELAMNSDDVRLVQQSWRDVMPIAATAAELFYKNLFTLDPGLEPLFRGDMKAQGEKLMTMIGVAVDKLDDIDALLPVLSNLGRRHAGYGVKDHHYESVAAALLATLSQSLGQRFTPALK